MQLVRVLIEKLPAIFELHFRRRGVVHALSRLAASETEENKSSPATIEARNLLKSFFADFGGRDTEHPGFQILNSLRAVATGLVLEEPKAALTSLVSLSRLSPHTRFLV